MNTKQLRQKILDLAIRGKLVPQDPNDEPASVLLERIRAEKERLIKEKKIKPDKKKSGAKSHYGNFFKIPDSWTWVKLGEIAQHNVGKTLDKSRNSGEFREYITTSNLYWGRFVLTDLRTMKIKVNEVDRYTAYAGDLLVCEGGDAGRSAIWSSEQPICFQNHIHRVRPWGKINSEYLYYFMFFIYLNGNIKQYLKGVGIQSLSGNALASIQLPLPPINEQYRIVNEIERLFSFLDSIEEHKISLEQFISLTKSKVLDLAIRGKLVAQNSNDEPAATLLKSISKEQKTKKGTADKFHYPFEIPEGWLWITLGEIGTWQSGSTPRRSIKDYYNGDIPWLKTGDLTDGLIYEIPETITQKALSETSLKVNPPGSVLIAMYGATIGKVGILTIPATTNQACCACSDFKGITNLYLFNVLIAYREYFIQLGEGGAQPNISKEKIVSTYIPLPPINEQKRIVSQIEKIFAQLNTIKDALKA